MLFFFYGIYRFATRRIAYRNDYCLRCDCVRLAELIQTFDVGHFCYLPLLPLGRWRRWYCTDCGRTPHTPVAPSRSRKVFVTAAFPILTLFAFLIPITRPEDASGAWVFRLLMLFFFLVALSWCRTKPPADLEKQLLTVPPSPQDLCVFCDGPLDARGFCGRCTVTRLDVTQPELRPI